MNGLRVGTWSLSPQGDEFVYADTWLEQGASRPLSLSMPLRPANEPYRGTVVRAWFDNLLPDSKPIRDRLARRFGTGSSTPFDLLAQAGRDCVGAVQIVPEDEQPGDVHRITGRPLNDAEVEQVLRDSLTPGAALGRIDADTELRLSIAGAQEKTALLRHEGEWWLPSGPTPTTHILKLPLGLAGNLSFDLEHSVQNEWLCARILTAFDLPVANCEIATFGEFTVLVVERFDRQRVEASETHAAWWQRRPQEDLCQATGTAPEAKYEADGGPGMDAILGILVGATNSLADRRKFLKAQVLFWLLQAPDGHAKNFSVAISQGGNFSLTPLYDVLSAAPFLGPGPRRMNERDLKLAMAVRGRNAHWKMNEIQRRHWSAVSQRAGLGNLAEEIVEETIASVATVLDRVATELPPGFPDAVATPIFTALRSRTLQLSNQPAG
jgi:serine/threonine-protein kinase HipA